MPTPSRSNSVPGNEVELAWFHGKMDRQEAEQILMNEGSEEGLFLVRESPGVNGAFILSVINDGAPKHYQIHQHGEDAFFSIEDGFIVHGLDVLITHCWKNCSESVGPLTRPVKKDLPPLETRQHGRCNLLHRSTKEGNSTVVSELLRCGYRSLEAKNQDGQTAVHVAVIQGNEEILKMLVEAGANVNVKDNLELTPLHYACIYNHVGCLKILHKAHANSQLRQRTTGRVALHEAASRGHTDCVKYLVFAMCVPSLPRTNEDETPADLARKNGFYQCARILELYQPALPFTRREDWYHGSISRSEAERRLRQEKMNYSEESFYLIRKSSRKPGFFALSLLFDNRVFHFEVGKRGQYYFIDYGPYLESLEHLVEHYTNNSDGLPTFLQRPIRPKHPVVENSALINQKPHHLLTPPALPNRNSSRTPSPKNEKKQEANNNIDKQNNGGLTAETIDNIRKEDLELWDILGEGEFGSVYRGNLRLPGSKSIAVAVKTLREDQVQAGRDEFLREAAVMKGLKHPFIVRFMALCEGPPLMMVEELVPLGSLLDYLLDHPENISPVFELRLWAAQIAHGMQYLELKRFVHRDLAARNVLLASRYQIKISDFGLSRALNAGENYYTASKGGRWPVKWYAPESVNFGTFSHASDVWSYGVTLWEMFSFGAQPYDDLPGAEVLRLIEAGSRLPQPDACPDETYACMLRCWSRDPSQRPTFAALVEYFASSSEYANVQVLTVEGSFGSTQV